MQISVKLLASYRKKLPEGTKGSTCYLEIPAQIAVRHVVEQFDILCDESSVVLLNGRVTDPDQMVNNNDVVCVFPAFAGG
ncbi:MAG: MoaD/ThiS family protein [Anaerolineales bacterium]